MKYRLTIVWETGEKESYEFNTKEKAERAARNYRTAFGKQAWVSVSKIE